MKCVAGLLLLVALNTRPITSSGQVDIEVHVGSGGNYKHLNLPGTGATTNDHQSLLANRNLKGGEEDFCSLPPEKGLVSCYASIPSYTFDKAEGVCKKYSYGGCGATANLFQTKEECDKAAEKCDGYKGATTMDRRILSANRNLKGDEEDFCSLPPETGLCLAYIPSYYFDKEEGECKKFIYGGCGGNANRFGTKEKCAKAAEKCLESTKDICSLPKVVGPCKAGFPRYYFDKNTKSCQKFIYGGCKGNANNFRTWEECSEAAEKCVENNEPTNDVCSLPKVEGRCWAIFHRYYFDKNTRSCQKFIYGGCEGNANNFMTEEECSKATENCAELEKLH